MFRTSQLNTLCFLRLCKCVWLSTTWASSPPTSMPGYHWTVVAVGSLLSNMPLTTSGYQWQLFRLASRCTEYHRDLYLALFYSYCTSMIFIMLWVTQLSNHLLTMLQGIERSNVLPIVHCCSRSYTTFLLGLLNSNSTLMHRNVGCFQSPTKGSLSLILCMKLMVLLLYGFQL